MESTNHSALTQSVQALRDDLNQKIIGQSYLVDRLLIAMLADGHLIVEGLPGLAKTTAIKEMATCIEGNFQRIQFTPDLLPADITGTEIFRPQQGTFDFQPGPIFHNIVLADEINRAPAKVQSALLEAMAERQVSIGKQTYELPDVFMVMATQNPIEQEGTYPLPEAQLDRFLMFVKIGYPQSSTEQDILKLAREQRKNTSRSKSPGTKQAEIAQADLLQARSQILDLHISPALEQYLVQLVLATRNPEPYNKSLKEWIRFGASPRATIGLDACARAHAWLNARDYIAPEDIHAVAHDVLRHRILLTYHAEVEGITTEQVIDELLKAVPIP